MSTSRRIIIIAAAFTISLASWLYGAGAAQACSCMAPPPPETALQGADLVFVGTVESVENPSGQRVEAKFRVSQGSAGAKLLFKGEIAGDSVVIDTPTSSASCGYNFEAGSEYLVYASVQGDRASTGLCTRTALLGSAGGAGDPRIAEEIALLRGITSPGGDPGGAAGGQPPGDGTGNPSGQAPPPATAPQQRGCAGCAAGSEDGLPLALLALMGLLLWRRPS